MHHGWSSCARNRATGTVTARAISNTTRSMQHLAEKIANSLCPTLAASKALPFRAATDGETVGGKFTGTVQLSSGKFAIVEKSHEFTLVPWRPVIDRQLGREVMGVVQGGSVTWQLGRVRGLEI